MASRLNCRVGALVLRALRACSPRGVSAVHSIASGGGVPTDEQTTGLEMEAMMAAWKGLDPYVATQHLCVLQMRTNLPRCYLMR
uniref:Uncharacterized protein n=1 Tax=Ursus maritimus TaxID=29073 RepID=A0A452VLH5_URSMA